jgi:hypothetical protein
VKNCHPALIFGMDITGIKGGIHFRRDFPFKIRAQLIPTLPFSAVIVITTCFTDFLHFSPLIPFGCTKPLQKTQIINGTLTRPIHKCGFCVLDKAAQGFVVRRTQCTSQPESRGERRPAQKRPFMVGR